MPGGGGNASTVNGKTVETSVPAGAKFTDTISKGVESGVTEPTMNVGDHWFKE